jgi:oxygen-dependent protoporphyrinogen oxidase
MVVNLFYRYPDLLRHTGFGYLIPRSIPLSQNPECALGVVFDSFVAAGMDTVPGTKITVMLGGHYWDCFSHYPDEEEGAAMAKRLLKRHLGIDMEPEKILVGLNRDCIPQYYVGHEQRMITTTLDLQSKFNRKLGILGSSYFGVGVNDCIKEARKCATGL